MARKLGTSVRNFDVVKPQSAKFEPSRIQTHFKTMQNLAHLQKTETTRTIRTCSKTLENKQKTRAILVKTRETELITECRRITRFRFAETQQNASQNQAMGRKIADVPSIRTSAPIKPSFQKLAKSEDARKVGANKIKAHAVAVETRKQTAGIKVQHNPLPSKERSTNGSYGYMHRGNHKNKDPAEVPCSVMEPSSKSKLHTVAGCSTSVLHRRLCYDAAQRERIRKANMKKNQSKPEGACFTPVKQMIPHSDAICSAAARKGESRNDLDICRVSSSVCKKLVLDEDVSEELNMKYPPFKSIMKVTKYPPFKSIMKVRFTRDLKSEVFKNIKKVRFAEDFESYAPPVFKRIKKVRFAEHLETYAPPAFKRIKKTETCFGDGG